MRTIDQTTRETQDVYVVNGRLQVDSGAGGGTQNVAVTNFPATQPVSGTVTVSNTAFNVSNFPTTQFVAPAATFPVAEAGLSASIPSASIAVGASTYQSAILDTGATTNRTVFYITIESTAAPTTPTITMEQSATNSATGLVPMVTRSGTAQAYAVPAAFPSGATGFALICEGWHRYVRYTVNLGAAATAAVTVRVYRQTP